MAEPSASDEAYERIAGQTNPYDGHTLSGALEQVERLSGQKPERFYVDRGYKGHKVTGTEIFISGQRRGITPIIRWELRRRSAFEPVIGHQKSENRLDRNILARSLR